MNTYSSSISAPAGQASVRHELDAPTPRPIRRRPGRGTLISLVLVFLVPHTLAGVALVLFTLFQMALSQFGVVVPGHVSQRSTYTSKGREYYRLTAEYLASGTPRRVTETVSPGVYEGMPEGTPVRVKTLSLGPVEGGVLMLSSRSAANRVLPLFLMALFWNSMMGILLWKICGLPILYRNLVPNGIAAPGEITDKKIHRGKSTCYTLYYQFLTQEGQWVSSKMDVHAAAFERVQERQPVTALYLPNRPRFNAVYEGADYEVG